MQRDASKHFQKKKHKLLSKTDNEQIKTKRFHNTVPNSQTSEFHLENGNGSTSAIKSKKKKRKNGAVFTDTSSIFDKLRMEQLLKWNEVFFMWSRWRFISISIRSNKNISWNPFHKIGVGRMCDNAMNFSARTAIFYKLQPAKKSFIILLFWCHCFLFFTVFITTFRPSIFRKTQ